MILCATNTKKKMMQWSYCIIFLIFIFFANITQAQVADSSQLAVQDTLISTLESPSETTDALTAKSSVHAYPDWAPDPKKATLWALIPGGGQIYNWAHHDKWWLASLKLAVIYGGFGTLTYFIIQNANDYKDYRDAYKWVSTEGASGKQNQYTNAGMNASQLESMMNYYLSNVEWCGFFTVLLYGLQIMEATVTAHLLTFDISDDLSLGLKPINLNIPKQPITQTFGLSMRYKINYK